MDERLKKKIDAYVDGRREEIIDDLRTLVRIPSVAIPGSSEPEPFGPDVAKVLQKALEMAQDKGMRVENHGNWYGLAKKGEGSHVIGIFSHLDVVEVDDRWTYPPFELSILKDWMIGRGSNDDKLAAVIGMHVAAAMEALGIGKNIELQLYMGCCEEKCMMDLDRYIAEQEQPEFSMVPDFIFPVSISEPGILKLVLKKRMRFEELTDWQGSGTSACDALHAGVTYTGARTADLSELASKNERVQTEMCASSLKLSATGKGDTQPGANDAINAVDVLIHFLKDSGILSSADAETIAQISTMVAGNIGAGFEIAYSDQVYGTLECKCARLEQKNGAMEFAFDVRIPGAVSCEDVAAKIHKYADAHDYIMEVTRKTQGSKVDAVDPRVLLVNDCWNDVSGRHTVPRSGGGTYARKLKNAVGFGPKDNEFCEYLPEGHGMLHGPDEAMQIGGALDALKTYIRAIAALDEYYA